MKVSPDDPTGTLLRRLPSVERVLAREALRLLEETFGRTELVAATRSVLDELREAARASRLTESDLDDALASLPARVRDKLESSSTSSLIPVINATGIIVHTNLGRAPLSKPAIEAIVRIASSYSNLELDLETGGRGRRERHASRLLGRLFPGHDALVVNNNAAAVLLALNTFAVGREVIVSRGELVEIGGSFRIPEILERSGARLREVGTTNKTRIADYQRAVGPETAAILRVHPSNFRIIGFTESASIDELLELGRARNLPVIEDFGSGNLLPLERFGLTSEPTAQASLRAGVDLLTFSGDKLLGGPQAGILVGTPERVAACRKNPLARALRVDKLTYAALEATLAAFVRDRAFDEIPVLRMLSMPIAEIEARAARLIARLDRRSRLRASLTAGASKVGGGAAPEQEIPSALIRLEADGLSSQEILDRLRGGDPPVMARISQDRVLLDLRTVRPEEDEMLGTALVSLGAE